MLQWIGKRTEPSLFEYNWKDVVLYALSIGAQPDEIAFIYENARGGLKVFPSFCVIPAFEPFVNLMKGMDLDLTRVLHGEQRILLHRPIPPEGRLRTTAEVTDIFDKGKGKAALICISAKTEQEGGGLLFENRSVIFYRGGGGFGGDPGPPGDSLRPPDTEEPEFRVSYPIPNNQAALYRLNGDRNPLHIDPDFAALAGFERPILHGLCSFGYASRAILHSLCKGDVARFREFKARFCNVVFPGETLITEGWKDEHGRYLIRVRTDLREVMNQAYAIIEQ